MASEEEIKAVDHAVEKNAESAQDVKTMLAELKAEKEKAKPADADTTKDTTKVDATSKTEEATEKKEDANGTSGKDNNTSESTADLIEATDKKEEKNETAKSSESKSESRDYRGSGRPRGRGGFRRNVNYQDNIKSDLTSQKESSDPDEIRKQVEFYFSDSNLPMDKFLLSKTGGNANNPVPLSIIQSFKRMRRFKPDSAIVEALRTSDFLELAEEDIAVRRKKPLPETVTDNPDADTVKGFEDAAMGRSVYAKGFGKEQPSTQFDIEAFFTPHGPTNAIRLRRANDKTFKGSVFVEFDSEATQQAFLALEPKPKWKGQDLLIKSKKEYCDEKAEDIKAGRIKPNTRYESARKERGDRGDDRDWRVRRDEDRRGGYRDRDRGGRSGHKGFGSKGGKGRDRDRDRDGDGRGTQRDSRGVPVIQSSTTQSDGITTAEVLAKARAEVEAENMKDEEASTSRKHPKDDDGDEKGTETGEKEAKKVDARTEAPTFGAEEASKKRTRDDDDGAVDGEREAKKVYTRTELDGAAEAS